jgi:hypothetical protein
VLANTSSAPCESSISMNFGNGTIYTNQCNYNICGNNGHASDSIFIDVLFSAIQYQ